MKQTVQELLQSILENKGIYTNLKRFNAKKECWNTQEIASVFEKEFEVFNDADRSKIIRTILLLDGLDKKSNLVEIIGSSDLIYEQVRIIVAEEEKLTLQKIEPIVIQFLQELQKDMLHEKTLKNTNELLLQIHSDQRRRIINEKLNEFSEKEQLRMIRELIKKYRNDPESCDVILYAISSPERPDTSMLKKALAHVKF